ncbi:hypothetical protein DO97_16270 [Neosynechococcus sphagnicola sy1]|uniref:Uncharacterized protein n=1 Tax=Neosynechococcus sphagnicola sy1 TaxID=1497020 RepID=A0A098TGI6_9CYAN|nr:hypothetical protein DO97_16270 [Neosynechococcus sphagnicola sy1]
MFLRFASSCLRASTFLELGDLGGMGTEWMVPWIVGSGGWWQEAIYDVECLVLEALNQLNQ